jgi:S-adenosyl methyltransferase
MSIDITRPHVGRIYDYVLGGNYNYEADRKAAEAILDLVPAYPRWAKLNRAFLGHVGRRWAAEGRRAVLDLGSGLPTQGHFNEHLPGAKILFADSDPLTVAQGRQLLAYSPDMAYVEADVRNTDAVLAEAAAYFGDVRTLAVGCIGMIYFLSDDEVRSLARRLHAFCAPGSVMALTFHSIPDEPGADAVLAALHASAKLARIDLYARSAAHIGELITPWRLVETPPLTEVVGAAAPPPVRPDHPIHRVQMTGGFAEY